MHHKGIVLRANSAYRNTLVLLDEKLGKIECFGQYTIQSSHGALITYTLKKRGMRYVLADMNLQDLPLYWARDNFSFFHHVLELIDAFLPWDSHCEDVFQLLQLLYTTPEIVNTAQAQQRFLYSFFKRVGVYPEPGDYSSGQWLEACINEYPGVLRTAGFLKELNEQLA